MTLALGLEYGSRLTIGRRNHQPAERLDIPGTVSFSSTGCSNASTSRTTRTVYLDQWYIDYLAKNGDESPPRWPSALRKSLHG